VEVDEVRHLAMPGEFAGDGWLLAAVLHVQTHLEDPINNLML
jgi:hypothetical protein